MMMAVLRYQGHDTSAHGVVIQNCVTGCIFQLNYKIQIKKNRNLIKNKKLLLQYYESMVCFSKIFMQAS